MRPPGTKWTPEMLARLRELYRAKEKLSFDGIAAMMNADFGTSLSRNACIGKAHRLNLPLRGINPAKRFRKTITKGTTMQKPKPARDLPPEPPPVAAPAPAGPFSTTIYQLTPNTCRWPGHSINADTRPPFFYCGEPAIDFEPYCDGHMLVAHPRVRVPA